MGGEGDVTSLSLPDALQDARLQCRCECHAKVGATRCGHCWGYFTNDWSEDITDWNKPASKRVEYRIRD